MNRTNYIDQKISYILDNKYDPDDLEGWDACQDFVDRLQETKNNPVLNETALKSSLPYVDIYVGNELEKYLSAYNEDCNAPKTLEEIKRYVVGEGKNFLGENTDGQILYLYSDLISPTMPAICQYLKSLEHSEIERCALISIDAENILTLLETDRANYNNICRQLLNNLYLLRDYAFDRIFVNNIGVFYYLFFDYILNDEFQVNFLDQNVKLIWSGKFSSLVSYILQMQNYDTDAPYGYVIFSPLSVKYRSYLYHNYLDKQGTPDFDKDDLHQYVYNVFKSVAEELYYSDIFLDRMRLNARYWNAVKKYERSFESTKAREINWQLPKEVIALVEYVIFLFLQDGKCCKNRNNNYTKYMQKLKAQLPAQYYKLNFEELSRGHVLVQRIIETGLLYYVSYTKTEGSIDVAIPEIVAYYNDINS